MGDAKSGGAWGAFLAVVLLALAGCGRNDGSPPTYYGEVARVFSENCTACHTEGGIAPFALDDPERAASMAPAIARAVKEGVMPPWLPGPESPPMRNERRLSAEERSVLLAWAEAGAPLGQPSGPSADDIPRVKADGTQPDLTLIMDPPYRPDRSRDDDYRCFLLGPQFARDSFVTGYRVRTDQSGLVHHAFIFVIGAEAVDGARTRDGSEAGPGWTCFGGQGLGTNLSEYVLLGFWVPGAGSADFPEGTGKLLRAGSQLVMQVHYQLVGAGDGADASGVELFLAPPTADLEPIEEVGLAAPIEVRCPGVYPSEPDDPCNREYALRESELRRGAEMIHFICGTRPEEYLRSDIGDGSAQAMSCDRSMGGDSLALGVTGHMHLRGRSITITLNPGTAQANTLLDIPRWDFDWQGQYWFREPIPIRSGDVVRITCIYDNSGPVPGSDGDLLPPRYITWGEGATDEMCLGDLAVLVR